MSMLKYFTAKPKPKAEAAPITAEEQELLDQKFNDQKEAVQAKKQEIVKMASSWGLKLPKNKWGALSKAEQWDRALYKKLPYYFEDGIRSSFMPSKPVIISLSHITLY